MTCPLRTIVFIALGLSIGVAACQQPDATNTIGVTVGDVLDDPDAYYRSTVTVSGSADEVITPTLFTIQGGETGRDLLVFSTDSIAPASGRSEAEPVRRDDIVQVTGRLHEYARTDIESEYGVDLSGVDADLEGRPILIAQNAAATLSTVIVTPRPGSVVTPPGETETITDFAAAAADDAHDLAGEPAHFENLTVAEVIDDESFWAAQGNDSLFVVLASGAADVEGTTGNVEEGQSWSVYGILREVPSSTVLAADWRLSQDLIQKLQDDPVYLFAVYGTAAR